jgi:tetratricopeptide (TPR) repeat protein
MKILHTQVTPLLKKLFKFERCGKYEEALTELKDIWEDTTIFPNVEEFKPRIAAEIILRCGSLIGFHGHNKQIPNAQEKSKNLLTEARNRFLDIYDVEKIAECENYLALAYWRTGELNEAESFIEEALSRDLPISSDARIYSHLTKSLIFLSRKRYKDIVINLKDLEADFLKYGDAFLLGSFCTNLGIALRNLGKISEALEKHKLAKYFHEKSGHKIYLGTVENNLAYLYKSKDKFKEAYEAIDNAVKIFKQIKDQTREGFSLDTKAQIYFAEGKYTEALKIAEKAVDILKKGENKKYLVESFLTKAKILIYLEDDISTATLCLSEAIELARTNISEEAARDLVREFEKTRQEKSSPVIEEISLENKTENTAFGENLELVLPKEISHYNDIQGVWIKNNHLEAIGLKKDSLAIVAKENVKPGDLAAIAEIANDSVSCGFYDSDFGIVCLEGTNSELQLFDEKDIKILGKIVGVCKSEKSADGKMIVEPINL